MQALNYVNNVVSTVLQGKEHFTNIASELSTYATNLSNAVQGKEHFETTTSPPVNSSLAATGLIFYLLFVVIMFVLYSYGAARLSYCYNIYLGSDSGTAFFWSVLSFLFSGYYYPIYGVFLNPLCDMKRQVGGRRKY